MAAVMDRHSRVVAWLKIVLPLLALVILSNIFLVARQIEPEQTIPYSEVDVEELAREQRIGAPTYAGMTAAGATVYFEAESARPENGGTRLLTAAPRARIELPGGRTITVVAESGDFDRGAGLAHLAGGLTVITSDGYRMETAAMAADLGAGTLETAGAVRGTAPFGTLEAGRMQVSTDAGGGYVLGFDGGVKLVYRPGK